MEQGHHFEAAAYRYRQDGWWRDVALIAQFRRHVEKDGEALAVAYDGRHLSRQDLWDKAGVLKASLREQGAVERQVALIDMPNNAAWMIAFVAILQAGMIPATLPSTTTVEHLRHIMNVTQPAVVFSCEATTKGRLWSTVQQAAETSAATPCLISIDDNGRFAWQSDTNVAAPVVDHPTLAHLMFTSGTTGDPKAVMHSENTLDTLNRQFAERFSLDEKSAVFMASPLGHSVGAIHGARLSLWLGSALILQQRWQPVEALHLVEKYGAAFTAAATPFLFDLIRAEWPHVTPKLAPLRWFLCGGAQVPPELVRQARDAFPNTVLTPLWGMTEGGLTTCLPDTSAERLATTVGVGLPDLEVKVIDKNEVNMAVGAVGELTMRGPGVFLGYYQQEAQYLAQLTAEGYFRTGDLATIDADGYVAITGRAKDLIIRGGVNISPVMTENAVAAHPNVRGVAVIGWPDERLGERLCAVITPHGTPPTFDELIQFCLDYGLYRRYLPERLVVVDSFPLTAAGKIRKHILKESILRRS